MPWSNGLYWSISVDEDEFYTLMMRLDLHGRFEGASLLSVDLYHEILPKGNPELSTLPSRNQPLGSFRSQPKALDNHTPIPDEFEVELTSVPDGQNKIRLKLQCETAPSGEKLRIHYLPVSDSGPIPRHGIEFRAKQIDTDTLRTLTLEIDTAPELPHPLTARAEFAGKLLSMEACFRDAGIKLLTKRPEHSTLPGDEDWTIEELRDLAEIKPEQEGDKGFFLKPEGSALIAYLMIATRLKGEQDRVTMGIMFDRAKRLSAAVFYRTLQSCFGTEGEELDTNYVFTALHELAHCLNLPHAFGDKSLPHVTHKDATFMSYPQDFQGPGGDIPRPSFHGHPDWSSKEKERYINFWKTFRFEFHAQELLELRHGARRDILMGTGVSPYRGRFTSARAGLVLGGHSGLGMELRLEVERPAYEVEISNSATEKKRVHIFQFGEPIHVEARLRSCLKGERPVEKRLSVVTGDLEVHYQTPDGRFESYVPPFTLCTLESPVPIDGDDSSPTTDRFHKDFCLNLHSNGFHFLTPGLYQVRASYKYYDSILVSNILDLYVSYPTPRTEKLVVPLLDADVATFLAFRGVHGFKKADALLTAVLLGNDNPDEDKHPLFHYYSACKAMLGLEKPLSFDAGNGQFKKGHRQPAKAVTWVLRALGVTDKDDLKSTQSGDLEKLPFSNIYLSKISYCGHQILMKTEGANYAKALANRLRAALKQRGVPPHIRDGYTHTAMRRKQQAAE